MTGTRPIGDLIETLIDYRGKTPPKASDGVPLITAKVIKGGRILGKRREYIAEATYDSWMRRGLPQEGDILITTEAPLGEVAQVPSNSRIALAQRVILLRPDESKVDRQFFFHFLRSPLAQERLKRRASGTTVSGIRQPELCAVEISLLDRASQEKVGKILDALDQLIANNRQRIDVLEQMAQAIYREWFVRFRFPGHENATFADSSLDPIPEGWEVQPLNSVADVNRSSRRPLATETIEYLDISCLADRSLTPPPRIAGDAAPGRARRVVQPGDVVWSMVRPNRRAHALLINPGDDWIASTGLAVLTPTAVSSAFLFESVSTREFSDYLVSQEGGSAYPAVKPVAFETAAVLKPPPSIDARFEKVVGALHRMVWELRDQGLRLAQMSDLLLPKLVIGQIDVSQLDLNAVVGAST